MKHPNHYTDGQAGRPRRRWPLGVRVLLWLLAYAGVLVLLCGCQAPPTTLVVHGLSRHGEPRRTWGTVEWNEVNPGLGLRQHVTEDVWVEGGVFENSYAETSPYAGLGYDAVELDGVTLGVMGGLADYGRFDPAKEIGFLYARTGWLQLGYAPDLGQPGGDLLTLSLNIPLR